jgi:cytoskeletal protein CcmA (bactofilin family)
MFEQKELDFLELEEDEFDTVLASDITFDGKITFAKPFMIKGNISGTIEATSDLVIDSSAVVKANIEAERVLVKGIVEGNISAKKIVFVTSAGSVKGDITAKHVVLEPGSVFSGKCSMTE